MLAELLNAVINLARQNQDPLVVAEDGRAAPGEENAENMRLYATRGMKEIKPPRERVTTRVASPSSTTAAQTALNAKETFENSMANATGSTSTRYDANAFGCTISP